MSEYDLALMRRIDEIYTKRSTLGYRMIHRHLKEEGYHVGHNKVHRMIRNMGIAALYPKRRRYMCNEDKEHKVYSYPMETFRDEKGRIVVNKPNQVWSGDITYIPVNWGFM